MARADGDAPARVTLIGEHANYSEGPWRCESRSALSRVAREPPRRRRGIRRLRERPLTCSSGAAPITAAYLRHLSSRLTCYTRAREYGLSALRNVVPSNTTATGGAGCQQSDNTSLRNRPKRGQLHKARKPCSAAHFQLCRSMPKSRTGAFNPKAAGSNPAQPHAFRSSAFGWSITFGRPAGKLRRRVGASAASRNVCRLIRHDSADTKRSAGSGRTRQPVEVVFGDRFWGQVQGFSGSFRALRGRVAPGRRSPVGAGKTRWEALFFCAGP
jgi:hypothetical protein